MLFQRTTDVDLYGNKKTTGGEAVSSGTHKINIHIRVIVRSLLEDTRKMLTQKNNRGDSKSGSPSNWLLFLLTLKEPVWGCNAGVNFPYF